MSIGQRRDYQGAPILDSAVPEDPLDLFRVWFAEVESLEPDPTAMALATVDPDGQPSARMVLLKGIDGEGLTFYTNFDSRKGAALAGNPRASVLFYWRSLERQVRVEGYVHRVPDAESDAYFATRPIESRFSAAASQQSRPVADRATLEGAVEDVRRRFGDAIPRPSWWGGFRLVPHAIEFWQGRPNRLHDRIRFESPDGRVWRWTRLAP